MASEQMAAVAPRRGIAPKYGWALLETVIVFMVLAAPLISDVFIDLIVLGPPVVAAIYVIWAPIAAFRRASFNLPSKLRTALFSLGQLVSALMAVGGVGTLVFGVWMRFAYRPEVLDPNGFGYDDPFSLSFLTPIAFGLIIASVALFLASITFLRRDDESAGECLNRLRSDRMRPLLPVAAATLLLGFGVASVLNFGASINALPLLLETTNPWRDVDAWFLVSEFQALPVALLASAVLLVLFRRAQPAALACLRETRRDAVGRAPAVLAALAGIGSIGMFFGWSLYIVHVGMIAALGPVTMLTAWQEVSSATNDWIAAQREAGRNATEIASELHDRGSWNPAEPDSGLAELIPGLGDTLKESSLSDRCSVTLDAGVADNEALRDQDWIQEYETDWQPLRDISYCIRLACPSPVVWQERPVMILESSHPSRNRHWAYTIFMDIFGNGAAYEPGGYCTADGELADEFQG